MSVPEDPLTPPERISEDWRIFRRFAGRAFAILRRFISMRIWRELFTAEHLFSWSLIGWVESLLIGSGLSLLGITYLTKGLSYFTAAEICFTLAAIVMLGKIAQIAITTNYPWWERFIFTGVLFAIVGIGLVEGVRWLRSNRPALVGKRGEEPSPFPTVSAITADQLISLESSMNDFLYPTGTLIGGIAWQPNLVDVRVGLTTGNSPVRDIDLQISLNEGIEELVGIVDVKEASGIACTFLPQMEPGVPALSRDRLLGQVKKDKSGNRTTKPANVTEIIAPLYRVQCPYLERRTNLSLIIAAAEIEGKAAPGQHFVGIVVGPVKTKRRRFPRNVSIIGSFEAEIETKTQSFSFKQIMPLEVNK